MLVERQRYTTAEFEAIANLPENADKILELIDGEIVEKMASNPYSSAVSSQIIILLGGFVKQHNLGHVTGEAGGYHISEYNDFAPDVAFISKARQPNLPRRGFNPIPPDLAVEVISPSDLFSDVIKKVRAYLRYGTRLVWVVDPEEQIVMVYTPSMTFTVGIEGALDGGEVLPGFKLAVRDIFPE
jgi:Uma2 family endonuclease